MNNTGRNDSREDTEVFQRNRVFGWFFAFGVVGIVTVFGNFLTIIAFTRRQVHKKRACILLANLAFTDLMVGCLTVPLYIYVIGSHFWTIYPEILAAFKTLDSITGFASIMSISMISLERLFSIGWPVWHRNSTERPYIFAVLLIWLFASIVPSLQTCFNVFSFQTYAHVVVLSLTTPLVVTAASYSLLWIKKKKYSSRVTGSRAAEHEDMKLARTLLIVTVVFFITWLPFLVLSAKILYSCSYHSCFHTSPHVLHFTKLLHYGNSCANPVIYAMRIASFRMAIKDIFCYRNCYCRNNVIVQNEVAPFSCTRALPAPLKKERADVGEIEMLHISEFDSASVSKTSTVRDVALPRKVNRN